jgi:hypothetical protein
MYIYIYHDDFAGIAGIVIQGESESELPERLVACVALKNVDLSLRTKL